jgi:hypothetical protein
MNEPLKVLQDFMQPVDYTPDFLKMGSKNIVMSTLNEELGEYSSGFEVTGDTIQITIPEGQLFEDSTADPKGKFPTVMDKLSKFTAGIEDANIYVDSVVYLNSIKGQSQELGIKVAEKRLDLVLSRIDSKLEHQSVTLQQKATTLPGQRRSDGRPEEGYIRVRITQKELNADGNKPRKLGRILGKDDETMDVYNNFVNKMSGSKEQKATHDAEAAHKPVEAKAQVAGSGSGEVKENSHEATGGGEHEESQDHGQGHDGESHGAGGADHDQHSEE